MYTIEELQHLRATGKALPSAPRPQWLDHLSRAPSGLFPVPEESVTSGGLYDTMALGIFLAVIGIFLLVAAFVFSAGIWHPLWETEYFYVGFAGGVLSLIGLALAVTSAGRNRKLAALEISQYPLSPGDGALVMIPHRKTLPPVTGAWLVLREQIKRAGDTGSTWYDTPLKVEELTLTKTGEDLYSTNIRIPEDAIPSYEIADYQLQWGIEVERRFSQGTTIRNFYLLWVRPGTQLSP